MTTFDRREEAFEAMFAHEEDMHFRAEARRARMLAAWAAGLLGKTGAESEAYVGEIVAFSVANGGDEALYQRMRKDLGQQVEDAELRDRMARLMTEAQAYVKTA